MIFSLLLYQSCRSATVHFYPSPRPIDTSPLLPQISPTDTLNFTSAHVPVRLMPYNQLLPQYQSYWYDSVHYCPSTNPTFKLQYTTAPVPILLIRHSPLLPQYHSYWYPTVHCCPVLFIWHGTLLLQNQSYIYDKVHNCPVPALLIPTQYTTVPLPVLLILHSPLLS